ncbi:unnamed protein product [Polarella glacialis]|uniref:Sodium/calcium exchanger membrane region domain-containing protein n=1 Tax=Polarella glacialis TaxID=89957 RepID=A0A813JBK9_POLGL|nr:unnamed protein product [Polarella glacialis]
MADAVPSKRGASEEVAICHPGGHGQILPIGGEWEDNLNTRARVFLYLLGMLHCFMGMSIVSDRFMSGIERITGIQKTRRIPGTPRYKTGAVWNATVANLTLMALGSSAPEILLSLNDILKRNFMEGKLGTPSIVGSGAFNLFIIIAISINAVPNGKIKYIKEEGVYAITAFFAVFAYLWMFLIVSVITPNEVSVWEAVLTFLFFPLLVFLAYLADIHVLTIENIKAFVWKRKDERSEGQEPKTWLEKFRSAHALELLESSKTRNVKEPEKN